MDLALSGATIKMGRIVWEKDQSCLIKLKNINKVPS